MQGWIQLHRQIQENPLWTCEPFTRGQAWVDLLLLANHKESFFYKRNIKINVSRGQVARSEVELADRWKWSRSKVRKFLNDLEKEQQVRQQKTNVTQLLTIINYEKYQEKRQQGVHQQDTSRTPVEHQQDTYNNDNNNNNENNANNHSFDSALGFDPNETEKPEAGKRFEFHKIYSAIKPFNPNDANYINAYFQATNDADGEDVVNVACSMYVNYCQSTKKAQRYIPNVVNWLTGQKWRTDWQEEMLKELYEMAEKGDKKAEEKYFAIKYKDVKIYE